MYELNKTFSSGNYNITGKDLGIFYWEVQIIGGVPKTHYIFEYP